MTHIAPIEILLIEDNRDDIELTREALKEAKLQNNLHVVRDGVQALAFLHRQDPYADVPRPDLIFLDLNMPRKDGFEVLEEIQAEENLKRIPVVVLTTSDADEDVLKAYDLNANCYINKPVDFQQFLKVINAIENFWFTIVKLPSVE